MKRRPAARRNNSSALCESATICADALVAHLDVDGDLRDERDPVAARDHLHDGREIGRAETKRHFVTLRRAISERLIAQAVTLLKQHQAPLIDLGRADRRRFGQRIVCRHGQQKWVFEQPNGFNVGLAHRQCEHYAVEIATAEFFDQGLGARFAQFDDQIRMASSQNRQNFGQHVGPQRGNNAELEAPGENAAAVSGEIDEVARGRKHLLAAPRHLDANIGESRLAGPALDQFDIELLFQVANLHGKRRLANRTGFRRPAKMTVARNRVEIAKLPKSDHA